MNYPDPNTHRFVHLRNQIKHAEHIAGFGIGAMMLASLLRTVQTLPATRAEALNAWIVCAVTLLGWALITVGMRLTTQALLTDMQRHAKARTAKRVTPSRIKNIRPAVPHDGDGESLHRAVWALARQSKVR